MRRTVAALATALALIAVLLPTAGRAQSSIVAQIAGDKAASEKLYFSLNCGLDFAYLIGSPAEAGRTGGFNVGLSATIRLTDRLSLVPEITPFFPRGVSEVPFVSTGDPGLDAAFSGAEDFSTALALSYLDVPILMKYRLGRFEVGAGPYIAFLISARVRYQADLETGETVRFSRDVSERYRTTDIGLAAEASWTITKPRRGLGLVLHGRYSHGLANVLRAGEDGGQLHNAGGPFHNSVWHFFVSFPFVF